MCLYTFHYRLSFKKVVYGEDCEKTTWNELDIYTKKEWTYKR